MKTFSICFLFLSSLSFAQIATISNIQMASGFLDVCGRSESQFSKAQSETVKNALPSQMMETLKGVMDERVTDESLCMGYVAGLIEGWKEGHEHGVMAAQFPDGWPQDEKKALGTLPLKQLRSATAAMSVDVPCIPDYETIGQERDIVVKYIREQQAKNPFINAAMTHRVIWLAFQEAFPCKLQPN
jgi:Rap1a immunity proteins